MPWETCIPWARTAVTPEFRVPWGGAPKPVSPRARAGVTPALGADGAERTRPDIGPGGWAGSVPSPRVQPGGGTRCHTRVLPCPRRGWHRERPGPASHGLGGHRAPPVCAMMDTGDRGRRGAPGLAQAQHRRELEEELRDLSSQVAALGRSLAAERGRSLMEGGALRALEIAVGGAQARVGGACRALDRANERLRLQQEAGQLLWAELEAARAAKAGAELRAQEAESQCLARGVELEQLRQAVRAAQHSRRRAEQERDHVAAKVGHAPRPSPHAGDPGGLQAALEELREHNRGLREHLNQRLGQVEELRRALVAAGMRAREAQGAWARLAQEQRLLRERLQHPRDPPAPPEPALRARCAHLQELLQREAGARVALSRAARVTSRRLRVLVAEAEEQRLLGERYRLQARASEAAGRLLADQVAAVAAGTAQALAQGHHLRRELEDVGDGAAATARHVAVLRTRLRCDPMNLSRTVRRMLRDGDDDSEDSGDSEDGGTPPATPLKPAPGAWGGLGPAPSTGGTP
ncbi:myosin heavy chain, embryonic smooth muscle isoform-like isoform X2 [Corvus kubaryi]|uniref:myosin heavy chain, embryonic smooth muscle isoform-like isoform X2 n=1 Tax=Corvus kubaryi TaxID=68294 RepID=UPI001C04FE2C|nr:myosin heavy chain, embryonic smooth muscle isoform-like isoform X2 [Corvus kubaryi]